VTHNGLIKWDVVYALAVREVCMISVTEGGILAQSAKRSNMRLLADIAAARDMGFKEDDTTKVMILEKYIGSDWAKGCHSTVLEWPKVFDNKAVHVHVYPYNITS
jgi:hypothetical protein